MPIIFALLLIAAPLYVWRFSIGSLPTNFLMVFSLLVLAVAKWKIWGDHNYSLVGTLKSYWKDTRSLDRMFIAGYLLVVIASLISLFGFGFDASKFGQWIVLYLEPMSLFIIIRHLVLRDGQAGNLDESGERRGDSKIVEYVIFAAYLLLLVAGVLAIVQYTTLATLPAAWWGNANEPKRAIAFFAHPNAYGLFVTPLLAWLIPDAVRRFRLAWDSFRKFGFSVYKKDKYFLLNKYATVAWALGGIGMFLTLSRGAWLGLLVAAGLYVLLSANKKMFIWFSAALIALIIVVAAVPNLRYRVILPFYGEKSAAARISLWHTGEKMIHDNPLFGKGINGFDNNWNQYNQDTNLDHYNFPHNILLNFWIDLGLLGVVGMIMIFISGIMDGFRNPRNPLALGLLLFLAAIIVHGLIDIPYLKNDLALVFWMILAISL